jgi:hypothetical protein
LLIAQINTYLKYLRINLQYRIEDYFNILNFNKLINKHYITIYLKKYNLK